MTTSIAGYFIDELYKWRHSIEFHLEEIDEFTELLDEVIRRDTIPNMAAMAEHFLNHLGLHRQQFFNLKKEADAMEGRYLENELPIQNELVTMPLRQNQNHLRNEMRKTELSFLGLKYDCDKFLSETLMKQN